MRGSTPAVGLDDIQLAPPAEVPVAGEPVNETVLVRNDSPSLDDKCSNTVPSFLETRTPCVRRAKKLYEPETGKWVSP